MISDYPWPALHGATSWVHDCQWCEKWCVEVVWYMESSDVLSGVDSREYAWANEAASDEAHQLNQEALAEHVAECRPDFSNPAGLKAWLSS